MYKGYFVQGWSPRGPLHGVELLFSAAHTIMANGEKCSKR